MQFSKIIFALFGFLFLGLGAIGIFIPIWPTTPFVLLAVAFFSTSPNMKKLIMKNAFFREHIENFENKKGLSKRTFLISMGWLWGTLIISILIIQTKTMTILLAIVGLLVSIHLIIMAKGRKR